MLFLETVIWTLRLQHTNLEETQFCGEQLSHLYNTLLNMFPNFRVHYIDFKEDPSLILLGSLNLYLKYQYLCVG